MQHVMRHKRFLTKKPMTHVAIRMPQSLREMIRVAALREEISQSDFLRRAIEEHARRALIDRSKTERRREQAQDRRKAEGISTAGFSKTVV
jgi:hypothetical protein